MTATKGVEANPSRKDGLRILVCRLWPRGLTKERAALDLWLKELGPSTELCKWFSQALAKWKEFQVRYRKELRDETRALTLLKQKSKKHTVTLMYDARDEKHNGALPLKRILEDHKQ